MPPSLPRLRLCVAGAPGLSRGSVSPGTLTTACAVTTTLHTRLADLGGGRHVPSTSGPRQQNTKQPGLRLFCGIRTTTPGTTERRPQDHRRLSPANPNVLGTRVRKYREVNSKHLTKHSLKQNFRKQALGTQKGPAPPAPPGKRKGAQVSEQEHRESGCGLGATRVGVPSGSGAHFSWAKRCTSCATLRTAEPPCSSWASTDIMAWANRYVCSPWHTIFCKSAGEGVWGFRIPVTPSADARDCKGPARTSVSGGAFYPTFSKQPPPGVFRLLRPHLWQVEVPRLGVTRELQLLAYTTATATRDPGRVHDLHHSSQQCWILNPRSEARDRTGVLMDTSHFAATEPHIGNSRAASS